MQRPAGGVQEQVQPFRDARRGLGSRPDPELVAGAVHLPVIRGPRRVGEVHVDLEVVVAAGPLADAAAERGVLGARRVKDNGAILVLGVPHWVGERELDPAPRARELLRRAHTPDRAAQRAEQQQQQQGGCGGAAAHGPG